MGTDPGKTRGYRGYLKIMLIIGYLKKLAEMPAVLTQNPGFVWKRG
jgi:hypothetical protein